MLILRTLVIVTLIDILHTIIKDNYTLIIKSGCQGVLLTSINSIKSTTINVTDNICTLICMCTCIRIFRYVGSGDDLISFE